MYKTSFHFCPQVVVCIFETAHEEADLGQKNIKSVYIEEKNKASSGADLFRENIPAAQRLQAPIVLISRSVGAVRAFRD